MATRRVPVTLPFERIVAGLNDVQPAVLNGYPSVLHQLAFEARGGTLEISPKAINSVAEPLLPEIRAVLEETWGSTAVHNWYSCSEGGPMAISCDQGRGLHLSEDPLIAEPVDARGGTVPPGVRSAKVYLTNLYNPALPLVRYEITDEVTLLNLARAARRTGSWRTSRAAWKTPSPTPGVGTVHPHLFRTRVGRERGIIEYQVRQRAGDVVIAIRCRGEVDVASLRADIASNLARLGLEKPGVSVSLVERLERHPSGKLKRFVALTCGTNGQQ